MLGQPLPLQRPDRACRPPQAVAAVAKQKQQIALDQARDEGSVRAARAASQQASEAAAQAERRAAEILEAAQKEASTVLPRSVSQHQTWWQCAWSMLPWWCVGFLHLAVLPW
jgi:hypothetical protein